MSNVPLASQFLAGSVKNSTNNLPPQSSKTFSPKPKNSNTLIGRFLEHSVNVGFQKSNRFVVLIKGPNIKANFYKDASAKNNYINFGNGASRMYLDIDHQSRLALTCQDVTFGGKSLTTEEFNLVGNAPNTTHAYGEVYTGDLNLTFLNSSDFFERMYFQNWMDKIINTGTHEVALYDDYAKPWSIVVACLPDYRYNSGNFMSNPDEGAKLEDVENSAIVKNNGNDIYFIRYDHVYPFRIAEQTLISSTNNDLMKFNVQFKYHRWYDPVVKYKQDLEFNRQGLINLPTELASQIRDNMRRTIQDQEIAANYTQVQRLDGPNYSYIQDPVDIVQIKPQNPFERFKKIARNIARYSNPKDMKGLIVNEGLGKLNDIFGEGNVENVAVGGQIADVYIKTEPKNYETTTSRLIGPLGELLR